MADRISYSFCRYQFSRFDEPLDTLQQLELLRNLGTWELDIFSFTVQPFNPSTSAPGDELHRFMENDRIAKFHGTATRSPDEAMRDSGEGLIAEVGGLSERGYGQVAAKGTTPAGYEANIGSPKFESEPAKNLQRAAQPRRLRVHIRAAATVEEEEEDVVRALLEFYGRRREDEPPD